MAVNNMSQGLCMFDSDARIVICNDRYLQMYQLSPKIVKPGCTLRELIQHRIETGGLQRPLEEYVASILKTRASGKKKSELLEMGHGRMIQCLTVPMRDGSWVVTHEDVTESHRAEQERAALMAQGHRRTLIESAIASFRERVEAMLKTVNDSAVAMKSAATELSAASGQTSQRAEGAVNASNEASSNVSAAAAAAEQLLTSITEIGRQLSQTSEVVRVAVTEAQATNDEIVGLAQAAQKIGDVIKLIRDIAGQTNLLALNATIEAARAGEFGQGLRGGRLGSEIARRPNGKGDRRYRQPDFRGPEFDHRGRRRDPSDYAAHAGDQPTHFRGRRLPSPAERGDGRDFPQRDQRRTRHEDDRLRARRTGGDCLGGAQFGADDAGRVGCSRNGRHKAAHRGRRLPQQSRGLTTGQAAAMRGLCGASSGRGARSVNTRISLNPAVLSCSRARSI